MVLTTDQYCVKLELKMNVNGIATFNLLKAIKGLTIDILFLFKRKLQQLHSTNARF